MRKVIKFDYYPEDVTIDLTKEQQQIEETSQWDKRKVDYDKVKYRSYVLPLPCSCLDVVSAVPKAGHIEIYCYVDTEHPLVNVWDVIAVRTNTEPVPDIRYRFVDTIKMTDGSEMFHIFYRVT